jgi:hypothetical protein
MSVIAFPSRDGAHKGTGVLSAGPTAGEGLQLLQAFMKIQDRELRAQLIQLAERFSDQQYQGSR